MVFPDLNRRPNRRAVYGPGSEKETEWRRFHAPQTPGNSHCTPATPGAICFYADGVKLAVEGSPVLEQLVELETRGCHLILCQTCLNHFGLIEKVKVGIVGGWETSLLLRSRRQRSSRCRGRFFRSRVFTRHRPPAIPIAPLHVRGSAGRRLMRLNLSLETTLKPNGPQQLRAVANRLSEGQPR